MIELNATFIVAMVSFSAFILIMNAIYYKPVLKIIEERQKLIDDNYEHAKTAGQKASLLLADKEQKLLFNSKEAKELVADRVKRTNEEAAAALHTVRQQSREEVEMGKFLLHKKEQKSETELVPHIKELAHGISAKIFGGAA